MDQYKFGEFLGSGSFGIVYGATDMLANKPVAIKQIALEKEEIDQKLLREMSIQIELNHPNVVRLERIFVHEGTLNLVMEYFKTDLLVFLTELDTRPPLSSIKECLKRLISGVSYLHSVGIIHRDLKPENVLMNTLAEAKIGDFGLARNIAPVGVQLTPQVVTLNYRAPELLLGSSEYSKAVDMWSLGCIFAEIIINAAKKPEVADIEMTENGATEDDEIDAVEEIDVEETEVVAAEVERIFRGDSEADVLERIFRILGTPTEDTWPGVSLLYPDLPHFDPQGLASVVPTLDPVGLDLLLGLLRVDPSQRPSAELALKHRFFDDI